MSEIKQAQEALLPWKKEFYRNIETYQELGFSKEKSEEYLKKFLDISTNSPPAEVLKTLSDISLLNQIGTYTEHRPDVRAFMLEFLSPVLSKFELKESENLEEVAPLLGKFPVTLVANHLSHFDAGTLFAVLYNTGGLARKLAESMVFIAGRPVFQTGLTRVALYMINTLLVCSRKDLVDNVGAADIMTKVNMRSFRHSSQLQKEGKVIVVFPEGTRSRTGQLLKFVDAVYHYISNKVVIPISLVGTDKTLPANSFLLRPTAGSITIGEPVYIANSLNKAPQDLPESIRRIFPPEGVNKKSYCLDSLAMLIGKNLHTHSHGAYRNLYQDDIDINERNKLIESPQKPKERIRVIGHSLFGTAIASILANKEVEIKIFIQDPKKSASFNAEQCDLENYPFHKLPPNITFTTDPEEIRQGTVFIQAVHPWALESYYRSLAPILSETKGPIVNIMKGFTDSSHGLILTDLNQIYGLDKNRLAVLAGSNYPEQIMERKITGFELAAHDDSLLNDLIKLFNTGYIFTRKALIHDDTQGIQIGGALRTIYSMTIGLLDGYYEKNLGGNNDNTLFHISNRIFEEMVKVGVEIGGRSETFHGLSGLTDLMLSCFGTDSRDRHYGHDLALEKANPYKKSSGISNLNTLSKLIKIETTKFPILSATRQIIIEKKDPEQVFNEILTLLRKKILRERL